MIHIGEITSGTPKIRPAGIPPVLAAGPVGGVVGGPSGVGADSLTPRW
jgi:hypothetical protein